MLLINGSKLTENTIDTKNLTIINYINLIDSCMVSIMMESLNISNCKFVGEIFVLWERERDIVKLYCSCISSKIGSDIMFIVSFNWINDSSHLGFS